MAGLSNIIGGIHTTEATTSLVILLNSHLLTLICQSDGMVVLC